MRIILATLAVIVTVAACDTTTRTDRVEWTTSLVGSEGWEQLSGQSAVLWTVGAQRFTATASIAGDEAGAVRPWHVHHGTCATGGGIVGPAGDYPVLTVTANGAASATAEVPVSLDRNAPYHVNVHLSAAQLSVIIACGDLVVR